MFDVSRGRDILRPSSAWVGRWRSSRPQFPSLQEDGLKVAQIRFEAGGTSELDLQQATALLRDTQATIPSLEIQLRQAVDSLSVLLGRPPSDLSELLGGPGPVPDVPPTVAVGIPVELLRRRPDVRRAEMAAAAQSARIGVAKSELLPAFQLAGTVGVSAEDFAKLFQGRSLEATTGPSITWPILNYGRLVNNVRLQDATFQELATVYADTVLAAQRDVEDSLVGYDRQRAWCRKWCETGTRSRVSRRSTRRSAPACRRSSSTWIA